MPLIQWNNELSVGIASIDEQHKELINILNTLNDALEEGQASQMLAEIFDGLAAYTVKHFGYEEALFALHGYSESQAHKNEHSALINQVQVLRQKMLDGDFIICIEVMAFLKEWLTHHILITDKAYSQFLVDKGVV